MSENSVVIAAGKSGTMIDGRVILNGRKLEGVEFAHVSVGAACPPIVTLKLRANYINLSGAAVILEIVADEPEEREAPPWTGF